HGDRDRPDLASRELPAQSLDLALLRRQLVELVHADAAPHRIDPRRSRACLARREGPAIRYVRAMAAEDRGASPMPRMGERGWFHDHTAQRRREYQRDDAGAANPPRT